MGSEPVLETHRLSKDFGSGRGVFDLDLEVRSGEVLGFLGPNGAGKSTTMRMLVGLVAPTAGRARVLGRDVAGPELRRHVGYLAGDFGLYPQLTGAAALAFLARLRGGFPRGRIGTLAERLDAPLDRPIGQLSTGNRQKVGLIQALMHDPDLLILDEPIAGLDPLVQRSFHGLLDEARARGASVFLSSHSLAEVDAVADRVAILRAGRLVVVDDLEAMRAVAVQHWDIEFADTPSPADFLKLPGVRDAQILGRRLRIAFEGPADAVVKTAARHAVVEIQTLQQDLEDVFLRYYRDHPR